MSDEKLPPAPEQAAGFARLRRAHKRETAEDYVEMIGDLIAATGEARLVDLARRFGVSQPTASKVVARLQREGLITTEPYRAIFLTEAGQAMAARARARHAIVHDFLLALGVAPEVAAADAEGMEHHASADTLKAMEAFVKSRKG